jgi:hypothetical protein
VDELRVSIERQLEQLSDEAARLQAALRALGPDDQAAAPSTAAGTARSKPGRHGRTPARHAAGHNVSEAPPGPAVTGGAVVEAAVVGVTAAADRTAVAAGRATAAEPAIATGADRALLELRSELTAALRNGRH